MSTNQTRNEKRVLQAIRSRRSWTEEFTRQMGALHRLARR